MGLLLGGPTFGGIFFFEIWWAYYPVGLLSGGLTYGILRYLPGVTKYLPRGLQYGSGQVIHGLLCLKCRKFSA